ncbi:conserved hypothetical protein [Ricinus communis]|uniref:Uncharacterized protein n=1 Tax=Ricinus communis TaxID=3988 RepID=B9RD06_RICCO|nr:conserved hypothetical protein [Ricinus communis]
MPSSSVEIELKARKFQTCDARGFMARQGNGAIAGAYLYVMKQTNWIIFFNVKLERVEGN